MSYTEREKKVSDLVLILGGPRLLYALHKECGLASASTVRRHLDRPRFKASVGKPNQRELRENSDNFFLARKTKRSLQTAMVDDVNGEGRPRPRPTDAEILGFSRQSDFSKVGTTALSDYGSLLEMFEAYQRGELKLLDEITVVCVAANSSENYGCNLLIASGTKKKGESPADIIPAFELVVAELISDDVYTTKGPTSDFESDGASVVKLALHAVLTKFSVGGNVRKALGNILLLYNYMCGGSPERPIVQGCDGKHVGKRFRMAIKSATGITIVDIAFNRDLIKEVLRELDYTREQVAEMLVEGSADAQNVPAVMKLLLALASIEWTPVEKFPESRRKAPGFKRWLVELKILARYARLFAEVLTGQDAKTAEHLNLGQILRRASQLSHIAFVLFRRNGTKFIPGQNYSNTQLMIRAMFHAVAYAKAEGLTECFLFFVSDDRLEGFFGMGRVMECGRNFDLLEFEERFGQLMRVDHYKADMAELFKMHRRLGGHFFDHCNPHSFLHPNGVSEPKHDLVNPQLYSPPAMWVAGSEDCAAFLLVRTSTE